MGSLNYKALIQIVRPSFSVLCGGGGGAKSTQSSHFTYNLVGSEHARIKNRQFLGLSVNWPISHFDTVKDYCLYF
jgi:hypothetical protein